MMDSRAGVGSWLCGAAQASVLFSVSRPHSDGLPAIGVALGVSIVLVQYRDIMENARRIAA